MTQTPPKPDYSRTKPDLVPDSYPIQGREEQSPTQINLWQKIGRSWENAQFRTKLTILLVGSVAIPVIAVTQGVILIERQQAIKNLQTLLVRDEGLLSYQLQELEEKVANETELLANLLEVANLNVNDPNKELAIRQILANRLTGESDRSFYLIANLQGKTVAQYIQTIDEDFSSYSPLPKDREKQEPQQLIPASVPQGINIQDIPIVKASLDNYRVLSGVELLKGLQLQRLGLASQANIGIREQSLKGLSKTAQPAPEGTYDVDGGKAGLVVMASNPIILNGRIVGTVVVGTLLNRNYQLVDRIIQENKFATATIFAQDWRVSTNVPYTDKKTRAIGTRISRKVAQKVLDLEERFVGESNILGNPYLSSYSPIYSHEKKLNPEAKPVGITYVGEPKSEINRSLVYVSLTGYGVGGAILVLGALVTVPIANSLSQPLSRLAKFVKQVGAGERGLTLAVEKREDEIGILSQEINQMVGILTVNEQAILKEAERSKFLQEITTKISRCEGYEGIINLAVAETRQGLKTDRVLVYQFNPSWQGTVIAESVALEFPTSLGAEIDDPCFAQQYVNKYQQGRVQATSNVYQAGLTECHIKQLEPFAVKANLVAPIIVGGGLVGLFIAHHCAAPRVWQQGEIDLFAQIATQVGFAIARNKLSERQRQSEAEQRQAKEQLQKRALELLVQVDPVSRGDLSIRAQVTEDEIGTVADSYNSTIESLRKIVTQVKTAAEAVANTTSTNDTYIQSLSEKALAQTAQIEAALSRIQRMAQSITEVANNAQIAEQAVAEQNRTVAQGDAAMNRTVEGIMVIRETVAETAKKVKRLGESSQKISQVVNLISNFADQTNLLALNASIEAAHAGEEGRGFAVVAEEVRNLSRQSAEASQEIAKLVQEIQTETNEVVAAMEAGTEQVVYGTKLVEEARAGLNEIQSASVKINQLVEAIVTATVEQSQDSELVSKTMVEVAEISQENATSATEVLESFQQLLTVSQQLQETIGKFKVS